MDPVEAASRLLVATAAGMALGLNRDLAGKPLGTRTFDLVAMSAALIGLTVRTMPEVSQSPEALARVVEGVLVGVLTGIGFLGSGVILRHAKDNSVINLTTAATIWATAALGLVSALGSWLLFGLGAAATIVLLLLERPLERILPKRKND
jgi:putative Mg2+ transporter-C (MgtC) family protein